MNSNQDQETSGQARLCAKGCGFFGSEATGNMCSRCWKASTSAASDAAVNEKAEAGVAFASAKQAAGLGAEVAVKPPAAQAKLEAKAEARVEPAEASPAEASPTEASPAAGPSDERPAQKPGRCFSCNKRVGLTGFKCRCDRVFCSSHRYAEAHECPFDYKTMERQRLAKNNPLVQASKVDKL